MTDEEKRLFLETVSLEPFARFMDISLVEMGDGYALCEMQYKDWMENIHGTAHGGAIFSLIDEAFEISSNSHGRVAVALNMNITYVRPAAKESLLRARSKEMSKGMKTATYQITVEDSQGVVAICQALAYIRKEALPFLAG